MGKNRSSNNGLISSSELSDDTYTTSTGEQISKDGYSSEFFEHLENNIGAWIKYAGTPPDFLYTKEELEYILNHMSDSVGDSSVPSGFLTRVEKARHFQKHKYKVGDMVDDSSVFRSYSRDQNGTLEYIKRNGDPDRAIVIYRTNGNVKHFNASRFDDTYKWESESFVEQGRMRITGITELTGDGLQSLPSELGLNFDINSLDKPLPYSITIVDVEQV